MISGPEKEAAALAAEQVKEIIEALVKDGLNKNQLLQGDVRK